MAATVEGGRRHDLQEAVDERASVILTGQPGAGKACVLRALRHRLPQAGFRLTYCHNATLGRRDFYRQLCLALGLSPSAAAADIFVAISSHVEDLGRESVHPVFLLDEAHLLHQDMLDHLHILSTISGIVERCCPWSSWDCPKLNDRLTLRHNRSLFSRIHRRVSISPLAPEDTIEYVRLRMRRPLRNTHEVFTADALAMLHEAANGSLRDMDRPATAALREAARRKRKLVERDVLGRVIDVDTKEAA